MIPERVHRLVGYWCEDYRPYSEEDSDMYVRLRQLGLRSYYMDDEDVGLHLPEGKASPLLGRTGRSVFDEGDPVYRAQKDRWRGRYAGRRGLRRINQSLYAARLRPVYIEHGIPYRPGLLCAALRGGEVPPAGSLGASACRLIAGSALACGADSAGSAAAEGCPERREPTASARPAPRMIQLIEKKSALVAWYETRSETSEAV